MNARMVLLAVAANAAVGCSHITIPGNNADETVAETEADALAAPHVQVRVNNAGLPQRDDQVATTRSADWLPGIVQCLAEGRQRSSQAMVRQQPDVALEALRESLVKPASPEALAAVARGYDRLVSVPDGQGWHALVTGRAARPSAYDQYASTRVALLAAVRAGRPAPELADKLVRQGSALPGTMAALDARQLSGVAWLVVDRPREAADAFSAGRSQAARVDPYQSVQFGLLLSDALRRAGQVAQADRAWEASVVAAAGLARHRPPLVDPVYWDKASYLRPVSMPWPAVVRDALLPATPISAPCDDEAEAVVWGAIGRALLERDDCQSALVALKRAESVARQDPTRSWLRIAQAMALARLDQTPAATAVLVSLAKHNDVRIAQAATATWGGLQMRQGDSNAGFRLLVKAFDGKDALPWYGIGEAQADLGLVYLMRRDEPNGLRWLHAAQSRFAAAGDDLAQAKSLWNETEYLKFAGRKQDAADLRARLESFEADGVK